MHVAFVEFNSHHDECLYSQIAFVKTMKDAKVSMVCNKRLVSRMPFLDKLDNVLTIRSRQWVLGFFRIYFFLLFNNPDVVVFNTVHKKSTRKLLLFPFRRKTQFVGLLHQTSNANKSFVPSKIKKFFVLNDCLLESLKTYTDKPISSFYPIFFPESTVKLIPKKEGDVWIAIPGKVEKQRRDYEFLLHELTKQGLDSRIKLIFLGRAQSKNGYGQSIKDGIKAQLQDGQSLFWDNYVESGVIDAYLSQTDYILPLVHFDNYLDKITGTYNLAFAYKIPMLMEEAFSAYDDFDKNAIFYKGDGLVSLMNSLVNLPKKDVYLDVKWSFEVQAKRYVDFLER